MKRFALLLASAAFVTPALAADVVYEEPAAPVVALPPAYSWTGFYIGGQAGAAFNRDSGPFSSDNTSFIGGSDNSDDAAFIGGVHVGYDYQINNLIVGAIADINYIDASSATSYTIPSFNGGVDSFGVVNDINFVGTVRAKVGFAADRFAIYATGGLAYANFDNSYNGSSSFRSRAGTIYTVNANQDNNDVGYAVGGGVDYLVTPNLSLGLEYLYTDLGSSDAKVTYTAIGNRFGADAQSFTANSNSDLDFHTVWAKASFRFN
ncbi:outer membrane protein [Aureimonas sp. AU4]|uniref:outer membrane protein n=1 Tax=Aureimonas sp. AU4 TaxID=1638163 RepID=UPI0007820427|nr:outer membrane beta-barrel protein [Aureimonas sp. AU4]